MNILNKLTREYLKMNKKRTLVTIIGVILTGAMISGVTTLGASFQNFLVETQKQDSGDWEACFGNVKYENVQYIENNNDYKDSFIVQPICKSLNQTSLEGMGTNLVAYEQQAIERMNIKLTEGRYPENNTELLVPDSYMEENFKLKVGDNVEIITKTIEEYSEEGELISSKPIETKTFTIVGVSSNNRLTNGSFYKIITKLDRTTLTENNIVSISVNCKKTSDVYDLTEETAKTLNLYQSEQEKSDYLSYNNSLLMYKGVNGGDGFNAMLIGVCSILIAVVGIGSIIVIYNSFAISVSERKKQFGMLASIGATKKQIKKMVLYEGIIIGLIGIPLGILAGIFGIGVTLKVVDNLIAPMFANSTNIMVHFNMIVSYPLLLVAALLIAITIYLSVFIPARKASKISPIEAIRGNGEIKIKARKVKTPKFLRKLYGIEGDIALKNLKRSRKRYRTTVISLTISIVLFLTFNGFVTYMFEGFDALYTTMPYDYEASIYTGSAENDINNESRLIDSLLKIENTDKAVVEKVIFASTKIDNNNIDKRLNEIISKNDAIKSTYNYNNSQGRVPTYIVTLDNNEYSKYLNEIGINEIANDGCVLVNYVNGLYMYKAEYNIFNYTSNDKIALNVGSTYYNENDSDKELNLTVEKDLTIQAVTNIVPYGIPDITGYAILVVNNDTFTNIANSSDKIGYSIEFLVEAENIPEVGNNIEHIIKNYDGYYYYGMNVKEQMDLMNNLKLIIEIFLYGFIVLISLIGISNIFNTITTNVNLRRREFANLKSIGMTDKSFNKMMNLECLFYGTKALIFGLPIGCVMCYLLSKAFSSEIMFMFKIPWSSIGIVVVAVYLIVFMTMRYARNKIKKENIIDVLRDDNI